MSLLSPLSPDEIKAGLSRFYQPADQALTAILKSHVPFIEEVASYMLFSAGKRLRPVLFLLATRLLQKPAPPELSAIFEYLHAASLLHDDVVDNAGLRRGVAAARVKYGNPEVILVGDFLFSKSYSLAATVGNPAFSAGLAECTTSMAEGQVLELMHTGNLGLDMSTYLVIVTAKTAELIACACRLAAIYAQADEKIVTAFYQYGINLGVAFQMVDDALDYVGTQHEFGKEVGHDLEEGKITLPFIWARDNAEPVKRQQLLDLARQAKGNAQKSLEAGKLVIELGGVDAAMQQAVARAATAQQLLKDMNLPAGPDLDLLMSLASYVISRRQ